ncbi:MAG TPA: tetratricopeptide repeat protein [bacterium]|nr:tetratricopeptide repeat protein [bacterium]HPN44888.1 tetratricopeptide repeat protein [bacterium]
MKTKKYMPWLILLLSIVSMLYLGSCASTGAGNQGFDDELFSDESLEELDNQALSDLDASSDEAEVLRLLGITEDDNSQTIPQTEFSDSGAVPVNQLEAEAKRKETELATLKAELAERDRRIQELQNQMATTPSKPAAGAADNSFKGRYEAALSLYRNRSYRQAIQSFDELMTGNTANTLVDNCQYWKGECYYALGDFNQAILEFQKVFTYSSSNKLDSAQLKVGLCYLRLDNKDRARSEFEKLISNYPDSEYVSRAQTYLSRL